MQQLQIRALPLASAHYNQLVKQQGGYARPNEDPQLHPVLRRFFFSGHPGLMKPGHQCLPFLRFDRDGSSLDTQ